MKMIPFGNKPRNKSIEDIFYEGPDIDGIIKSGQIIEFRDLLHVFIGSESIKTATEYHYRYVETKPVLALPGYLPPFDFFWPVKGNEIFMRDTSHCNEDYVEEIVKCLFYYGAKSVLFFSTNGDQTINFRKE